MVVGHFVKKKNTWAGRTEAVMSGDFDIATVYIGNGNVYNKYESLVLRIWLRRPSSKGEAQDVDPSKRVYYDCLDSDTSCHLINSIGNIPFVLGSRQ